MAPKRYRCGSCRSLIDPDLRRCPFCGHEDPLRYLRRRNTLAALAAVVVSLALLGLVRLL